MFNRRSQIQNLPESNGGGRKCYSEWEDFNRKRKIRWEGFNGGGGRERKSRWDRDFPEVVEPVPNTGAAWEEKGLGDVDQIKIKKELDLLNYRIRERRCRETYAPKGRGYYKWMAAVKSMHGGIPGEEEDLVDESELDERIALAKMKAAEDPEPRDPEWDELDEWVARIECRRLPRVNKDKVKVEVVEDKDKDKVDDDDDDDDDEDGDGDGDEGAPLISVRGFTSAEYSICQTFMLRQAYEFLHPLPKVYRKVKKYVDIIRHTKGYGLTQRHYVCTILPIRPGFRGIPDSFEPMGGTRWEEDPRLKFFVPKMIEYVLLKMLETLGKGYKCLRVDNVVRAHHIALLISLSVLEEEEEGEEAPAKTVEVMFSVSRQFPPSPDPVPDKDFTLREWKLKHGSQILFSTSPLIQHD